MGLLRLVDSRRLGWGTMAAMFFKACRPQPRWLPQRRRRERGQGMFEYALILVIIALFLIAIVNVIGKSTVATLCNVKSPLLLANSAP